MTLPDPDKVAAIIRDVAATEIIPRFRSLSKADIKEKGPGDLVTVADEAAERALTARLSDLLPGSLVVGEEACAADPTILSRITTGNDPVWIIDPVDGTSNFASGRPVFAVLLALAVKGQTVAGWIFDPMGERMAVAERGQGAWMDGQRLTALSGGALATLRGSLSTKFFPPEEKKRIEALRPHFASTYRLFCAAHEYLNLLTGKGQFALYNRTMPWDHAAGALAYAEAGGHVARWDGDTYQPGRTDGGILLAGDRETWDQLRRLLFPGLH
ncbi:inositol-1-monophosphatase [Niveispirillum lacus]|uniref:Inositol-1-monophosphatase n=1 Tax=Niveispirillum lacus TaxID=1981099 RepID=A0A255YUE6_9PROT|nr:inositol monophosphatase family protein [Niveispirillum lacus]OYQ32838.1 inositol-1-monophosphatase [Niveispirillum lacus]